VSSTPSIPVYFVTSRSASNVEDDSEALNEDGSGQCLQPATSTSLAISLRDSASDSEPAPSLRPSLSVSCAASRVTVASPLAAFFAALDRGTVLQPWRERPPSWNTTLTPGPSRGSLTPRLL
jgi:hypothetical protein